MKRKITKIKVVSKKLKSKSAPAIVKAKGTPGVALLATRDDNVRTKESAADSKKAVLGKDEKMVRREHELMERSAKGNTARVGKQTVTVPPLQPAQAAEIAAKEQRVEQRKIEAARQRLLEKEIKAA